MWGNEVQRCPTVSDTVFVVVCPVDENQIITRAFGTCIQVD